MECKYFGKCASCTLYEYDYENGLDKKILDTKVLFANLYTNKFDIIKSSTSHFRYRAEFRIWHNDEQISYAMNGYNKEIILIDSCEIVSKQIYNLMPLLLEYLSASKSLKERLFLVEFLSTKLGDTLVTLIYHKKLDDQWSAIASDLEKILSIKIIGRSKKQKVILSKDSVNEELHIDKIYKYNFYENGFTQPNSLVNEKMINWVLNSIYKPKDLLELYCGAGNFTIALAHKFDKVLATEIAKISIKSAKNNLLLNAITNVEFARLSAKEITQALNKVRKFNRLKHIDLDSYNFSHIFIDPPRAGLDEVSINLVKSYDNIIYISCNPITLKRDLDILIQTHKIVKFALFDQFAYTNHIESGVILKSIHV